MVKDLNNLVSQYKKKPTDANWDQIMKHLMMRRLRGPRK